jgi:hypothetical protein
MSFPTSAKEVYRSRQRDLRIKPSILWKGTKQWLVPDADIAAAELAVTGLTWSHPAGILIAQGCSVKPHVEPGQNLLTVSFSGYDMPTFPQGRAYIAQASITMDSEWEERTSIEGVTWGEVDCSGEPDENGVFYRITNGAKADRVYRTRLWLSTGVYRAGFNAAPLLALQNRVNAASFLGFPAGTMLLVGVKLPSISLLASNQDVVPLIYDLMYSAKPWPIQGVVSKYVRHSVYLPEVATFNVDGSAATYYKKDSTAPSDTTADKDEARWASAIRNTRVDSDIFLEPRITSDTATFTMLEGLLAVIP